MPQNPKTPKPLTSFNYSNNMSITIDKTIALFNQTGKYSHHSLTIYALTEGRDKFCKMIQYGSRFIKYQADGVNKDIFDSFNALFSK